MYENMFFLLLLFLKIFENVCRRRAKHWLTNLTDIHQHTGHPRVRKTLYFMSQVFSSVDTEVAVKSVIQT